MSLFGNLQNNAQTGGSSLFGGSTQNKPSLFGNSTTANNQSQPSLGAFGGSSQPQNTQQQSSTPSLFGGNNQQTPSNNLFGQPQAQQNTQQQQPSGGSIFGGLGASTQQQNNQVGASLLQSTNPQAQNLNQSRLGMSIADASSRREKPVTEQMETVLRKWQPENRDCLMQRYLYNEVHPGTAPFWGPGPDDDEHKWEEALAKKPTENSVPVLIRGFSNLGQRLSTQVQAVQQLQQRLHEMNNSLNAMMQNHELTISVRAAEAKKKHIGLSQKCLGLAIKVQVLRSRGFVLDSAEEELKNKLTTLEKGVFDPGYGGREEEIWARMVALRERTRWLQSESEKLGRQVASGEQGGINEDVLKKTKKILSDYDAQISHLRKELQLVQQEFDDWQAATRPI